MDVKKFTVEELMLDEGFLDYCLHEDSAYRPYWEHVIESNADHKSLFEKAANNILMLSGNLSEKEILQQVEKIRKHLQAGKRIAEESYETALAGEFQQTGNTGGRRNFFFKRKFMAAALIVAVCAGVYGTLLFKNNREAHTVSTTVKLFSSLPGERKKIVLPDGTEVILNGNSRLSIAGNYDHKKREVELKGEGFFTVAKNPAKPFIVKSTNFSTTALGTAFYVHARNADRQCKVELLEGKVQLASGPHTITLIPGEEAGWETATGQFSKSTFDRAGLEQWVSGKLSFQNIALKDAASLLEKWYAVQIIIKNKNAEMKTISGEYSNVSLEDVLKVICFSISSKYTYTNDTVIIE